MPLLSQPVKTIEPLMPNSKALPLSPDYMLWLYYGIILLIFPDSDPQSCIYRINQCSTIAYTKYQGASIKEVGVSCPLGEPKMMEKW